MRQLLEKIARLKAEIDALRPLDKEMLGRIEQKFRLEWNYHSNAIEGNNLDFGETKSFLLHGITAAGKPLKDHLDLRGHNEAILALEYILKEERPVTETLIRELHKVILVEDSYNPAITNDGTPTRKKVHVGQYKTANNHVKTATGEIFYFASVEETPAKMHDLIEWLRGHKEDTSPIILAGLFHYKFIRIHPFDDGNGRLARILMNLILMRAGLPPVVVKTDEKEAYFRALRQADGGDENAFLQYIGERLLESLELYLKGAKGESLVELDDVDKEFDLLLIDLQEKEDLYFLHEEGIDELFESKIMPLITILINKLNKIDQLFFEKEIILNCLYLGEDVNDAATVIGRRINVLIGDFLSEKIERKVEFYVEDYQLDAFADFYVDFNWTKYKKGESGVAYDIKIEFIFYENHFEVCDLRDNDNVYTLAKIFYHKDNKENEEVMTEVSNKLLKEFIDYIRGKM